MGYDYSSMLQIQQQFGLSATEKMVIKTSTSIDYGMGK